MGYKGPKNRDSASRAKFNQQTEPTRYLLVRNVPFLRKTKKNGLLTVSEDVGSIDWRSIYFSTQESVKVGFF